MKSNNGDYRFFVERLKANNKPFKLVKSLQRTTLYYEGRELKNYINTGFNGYELNLIKSVKDNIKKIPLSDMPKIDRNLIKYISGNFKEYKGQGYELDTNAAYWESSYILGYITEDIYKRGQNPKVCKKARLVALGALAKVERILEYNGHEFIRDEEIRSPYADYFFSCAYEVGNIMDVIKNELKNDFLFFWVDAIFFKGDNVDKVQSILRAFGYESKYYKVHIYFDIVNYQYIVKREGNRFPKKYNFSKNN